MADLAIRNLENLQAIVRDTRILHSSRVLFQGREVLPTAGSDGFDMPPEYPDVVSHLTWAIYNGAYTRRPNLPGRATAYQDDRILRDAFAHELSQANTSRWSREPGWEFVSCDNKEVRLSARERSEVVAELRRYDGPDPSGLGALIVPRESRGTPAWYFAFGEEGIPAGGVPLTRFYWNISGQGAIPLLKELTRMLNLYRVPFQYKTLSDPSAYMRADAGVLYLPSYVWNRSALHISSIYMAVRPYLAHATPLFTRPLGPGLGVAEDPGGGNSFGLDRCSTIARALWDAKVADAESLDKRVERVVEAFEDRGITLDRMHVRPGSEEDYSLELPALELPLSEMTA